MRTENCLVELGTEELPPKALKSLGEAFATQFEAALTQADLSFDSVPLKQHKVGLAVTALTLLTQSAL